MATCLSCGHENGGGARFCEACGGALVSVAAASAQRKTVTVLFCDLTGSTALGEQLDPEPLRDLLARYFVRMKGIIEAYGGTVEKFIGDAVLAVFGVPLVHEDDALRACRAAVEMREALPDLGVEGRIGVMTGEVVTGTEERLATGDALNVVYDELALTSKGDWVDYREFIESSEVEKKITRAYILAFLISDGMALVKTDPLTGKISIMPLPRRATGEAKSVAISSLSFRKNSFVENVIFGSASVDLVCTHSSAVWWW